MMKSFVSFLLGAFVLGTVSYAHDTLARIERECKSEQAPAVQQGAVPRTSYL